MRDAVLAMLLFSACGGSSGESDSSTWTNGSRLRARTWAAPGGAAQIIAWVDTQRGEDCVFAPDEVGVPRCLPAIAAYSDVYADAACASPVLAALPGCDPPEYAWQFDECRDGYAVHLRGARLDPRPTRLFYRTATGACIVAFDADPSLDYYALGEVVDPTSFVAATRETEQSGPALREWLVADDGARQLAGRAIDPATDQPLGIGYDGDAVPRWFPFGAWQRSFFTDDTCSSSLACTLPLTCGGASPEPAYAFDLDPSGCWPGELTVAELGAPTEPTHRVDDAAVCVAEDGASQASCWSVGASVPIDTFPAVVETDEPGGRVRARYDAVEGGGPIAAAWFLFFDTLLQIRCFPLTAADGRVRCLPAFFVPYADLFQDAACSTPAGYLHRASPVDPCSPPQPFPTMVTFRDDDASLCGTGHFSDATRHIYRVGDALTVDDASALFVRTSGACVPFDPSSFDGEAHSIAEMFPTEFDEITERVE